MEWFLLIIKVALIWQVNCEILKLKKNPLTKLIFFSIVLAYLWPIIGRATAVSRKEVLYLFPFGLAAYLWGTLYINRSNKSDALNKLNKESKAINERGCKLLFFPEGTRHQGDKLLPFKKGAFFIAVQSQSMIQPVVVSKYTFLNAENKSFGRGIPFFLINQPKF